MRETIKGEEKERVMSCHVFQLNHLLGEEDGMVVGLVDGGFEGLVVGNLMGLL